MTRTVLITGAGGFVGSAIAEGQIAEGHAVLATDLTFDAGARDRLGSTQLIEGPLPEVLAGLTGIMADVVIHAAAITADPVRYGLTRAGHVCANTSLLLSALDWARDHGAGRFVFLSSSGVFGLADGSVSVDEHTAATATDPYSAAKRAGEILLSGASEPGFETVTLRLGPVFGPHEAPRPTRPMPSLVARMIAAARDCGEIRVATPEAQRDWTFLPDIARALGVLLDHPGKLPPLMHLTSGEVVSDHDLACIIAAGIPGTAIHIAPEMPAQPFRPVLTSVVASPLDGFGWTPLATTLNPMLPIRTPA